MQLLATYDGLLTDATRLADLFEDGVLAEATEAWVQSEGGDARWATLTLAQILAGRNDDLGVSISDGNDPINTEGATTGLLIAEGDIVSLAANRGMRAATLRRAAEDALVTIHIWLWVP